MGNNEKEARMKAILYNRNGGAGAYTGFPHFFASLIEEKLGISRKQALEWYQKQELVQLLSKTRRPQLFRKFHFHGLSVSSPSASSLVGSRWMEGDEVFASSAIS